MAHMLGTVLKCAICGTLRFERQGVNLSSGKEVWYLGCGCPAPEGLICLAQ